MFSSFLLQILSQSNLTDKEEEDDFVGRSVQLTNDQRRRSFTRTGWTTLVRDITSTWFVSYFFIFDETLTFSIYSFGLFIKIILQKLFLLLNLHNKLL